MGKFGGHVEDIREGDLRETNLYLIPYNNMKKLVEYQEEKSINFVDAWQDALSKAEKNLQKFQQKFWKQIFSEIGTCFPIVDTRGSHSGKALKLFVDSVHPDESRGLLFQLIKIKEAAITNSEGFRKLVKKFDKHRGTNYSLKLLPTLFTSSLYSSQSMLEDYICLFRELLEDSSSSRIPLMIENESDIKHKRGVQVRFEELDWLRRLCVSIPKYDLLPCLVAHRGFHNIRDRDDKRPIENSLGAFEIAWTSGIHLCECDIALTKDGKLVLAHDENFMRLALDSQSMNSSRLVSDLTFRELMSVPLKSGDRPPLLIDVLRSALAISDESKLVIEIKPGNEAAASALARLLILHPELRRTVAMIMSFDVATMHRLQYELNVDKDGFNAPEIGDNMTNNTSQIRVHRRLISYDHFGTMNKALNSIEKMESIGLDLSQINHDQQEQFPEEKEEEEELHKNQSITTLCANTLYVPMPKLMLLAVADSPLKPCELQVGIHDLSLVKKHLRSDSGSMLDGIYLQYEASMITPEGAAALRQLSEDFLIGVWSYSGKDPDNFETLEWLVRRGNCSFVNTDLPHNFQKDIFIRTGE